MDLQRSSLTVILWLASVLKKNGPVFPPALKAPQSMTYCGWSGISIMTCGFSSPQIWQFCILISQFNEILASSLNKILDLAHCKICELNYDFPNKCAQFKLLLFWHYSIQSAQISCQLLNWLRLEKVFSTLYV